MLTVRSSWLDSGRSGSWLWATRRCEHKGTIDQPGILSTDTHEKYVSSPFEQFMRRYHMWQYGTLTLNITNVV